MVYFKLAEATSTMFCWESVSTFRCVCPLFKKILLQYNLIQLLNTIAIIIFNKLINQGLSWWSRISYGSLTISKILSSTSTKTSWPACALTSSKGRQLVAYFICKTISGKLGCPNKKKKDYILLFLKSQFANEQVKLEYKIVDNLSLARTMLGWMSRHFWRLHSAFRSNWNNYKR